MATRHAARKLGVLADPPGTAGDDIILLREGEHIILAGDGNDLVKARRAGPSTLDGEGGDDRLVLVNSAPGSTLIGGAGNDVLKLRDSSAMLQGGEGDDRYVLDGPGVGGTVIVDDVGANRLRIENVGTVTYRHEAGGDDLHILLGEGPFDPTRDVVWKDFFDNPLNRVNGLTTAEIAALAPAPGEPLPLGPTIAEMIYASEAAYSRANTGLPDGLTPFTLLGAPVELEVTAAGFYGRALLNENNDLIIAFEGTDIGEISTRTEFVTAQIVADAMIYLGMVPPAFDIAVTFTETVMAAAALSGIASDHVFVTGHSLGAGIAMYVGARLDLAGMTFAAPGIAASAIPDGQPSKLVNYVEYGDPVGNYAANPPVMGPLVYSPDILRYGDATYLGDPAALLALAGFSAVFGPGHTTTEQAAALAGLVGLAATYHPLTTYAADLGVSLPTGDPLTPEQVATIVAVASAAVEALLHPDTVLA